MSTFTVNQGHVGLEPWAMVGGQVDHIVFSSNVGRAKVTCDAALVELRITNDGSTPAFGSAGASSRCYRLLGPASIEVPVPTVSGGSNMLKILSGGITKVAVQVIS